MKILVIGETCEDIFVYGNVDRLCPEAPVPILKPVETVTNKGMSGNVVENLKSLYPDSNITHIHQTKKITKKRFVEKNSNQMIMRLDEGENELVDSIDMNVLDNLNQYDIVLISDYNKGFISENSLIEILKNAKFSIMDTKRVINKGIIEHVSFIKVNQKEYNNNKSILDSNPLKVIVTLGKEGVKYNNKIYHSLSPQETIDVSGAGDTFVSSFTLKYFLTKSIDKSISFANEVCSYVVNKKGVSLPDSKFILK
jgi:bifunctional ADP-heptose synthase (sugar kinase/adenylyltransferase)